MSDPSPPGTGVGRGSFGIVLWRRWFRRCPSVVGGSIGGVGQASGAGPGSQERGMQVSMVVEGSASVLSRSVAEMLGSGEAGSGSLVTVATDDHPGGGVAGARRRPCRL